MPESEFWEPWTPQVGQLVRYRKNLECPVRHLTPDRDGALGEVRSIRPTDPGWSEYGHVYYVTDNGWYLPHVWKYLDGMFCAAELEPVEESERPHIQERYPKKRRVPQTP